MRLFAIFILCTCLSMSFLSISAGEPVSKNIKAKLIETYNVVNDSLDYMLTAKGATKTIAVLTPFFLLYCAYFDASPIQNLLDKILRYSGQIEGWYDLQKALGKSDAFWRLISEDPLSATTMYLAKILNKLFSGEYNPFKIFS